jgi:hypothetical protein
LCRKASCRMPKCWKNSENIKNIEWKCQKVVKMSKKLAAILGCFVLVSKYKLRNAKMSKLCFNSWQPPAGVRCWPQVASTLVCFELGWVRLG